MRQYELTLVLDPELTSENQKKVLAKIKKLITSFKGIAGKGEDWGKKTLAYPIKKKTSGVFHLFKLDLPEESVKGLDQKLRLEDNLIRFLLVKVVNKKKK